jgi:hypothetical protein|tara:strand:+ start:1250 stop:1624 length:375 start_codon:yes stop_codon:yes gene_type:complete
MAYKYGDKIETEQSHYDAGYLKILEIQKCWANFRSYYRKGNFERANNELDLIWMEFEVDSTDEDRKKEKEINDSIKEKLKERNPAKRTGLLFDILRNKRMFLGKVEKKQGMGKRYFDETAEDLI